MKGFKLTKVSFLLIAVIGVLLSFVIIVNPLSNAWEALNRRVEVVNLQYVRDTKTVNNFDEYVTLFEKYEKISRQDNSDEEELALFLKELEAFASGYQISIDDIKPLPNRKDSNANTFLIRLEMQGTIQDVISYMHEIADSGTLIRIENLTIQTVSRRNNILNAKITLSKTFLV